MNRIQRMYERQMNKVQKKLQPRGRFTGQGMGGLPQYVTSSFKYESVNKNNLRASHFSNRSSIVPPKSALSGIALELQKE